VTCRSSSSWRSSPCCYLNAAASPDQHRRALTYYEIALDTLYARLLQLLHDTPPTLMERIGGLLAFLRQTRDAKTPR
jgi:hypothetical protein